MFKWRRSANTASPGTTLEPRAAEQTYLFEETDFAVVDFETTGLFANSHDRVIEIGIVRVNNEGDTIEEYETLVNPLRDLGPTQIHGIRGRDVADAPQFAEIAGDICCQLNDAIVVAHNARFESAFITSEFKRIGMGSPAFASVCTMSLAGRYARGAPSRRLADCCTHFSIEPGLGHRALDDARATAQLLVALLRAAQQQGDVTLADLGCSPLPPAQWPIISPSGLAHPRSTSSRARRGQSFLSGLAASLPAFDSYAGDDAALAYVDILDRALEDRRVSADEADALHQLALDWGLSAETIGQLHESYLEALVRVALADHVLTEPEHTDLVDVAELLGLDERVLDEMLARSRAVPTFVQVSPRREEFAGKTVCFTGQLLSCLDGEPLTRARAQQLAADAGMLVRSSVSRKLDILVVADPDSLSGKARSAGHGHANHLRASLLPGARR